MRTLNSLSNLELIELAKQEKEYVELQEKDFYPPEDRRVIRSGVLDIKDGDNFAEYTADFFEEYESFLFE